MNELEQVKKEKEGLDSKLVGFQSASNDLDTLLGSQRSNKNNEGLGYSVVPPSCSKENHALVADDEAPIEFALMAKSSSSFENEELFQLLQLDVMMMMKDHDVVIVVPQERVCDGAHLEFPSLHPEHHFIRDCYEKKLINVDHIHTDDNVADLLTKPFDVGRFQYLVENPWGKAGPGKDVELHLYRSMIGSLMYLTASRPDIMFAVYAYARHQVTPKECHLYAVKRIFRYLKGHPKLGLWYPKESPFDLVTYSDSDYGSATQDRKSTTKGCQFLGRRLISWQCKKQTIVATSTTKAEYVAAASSYGQVL
nr:putative ribonuclease H-like domain-containing protein [Tanacetum cinerariifolium]